MAVVVETKVTIVHMGIIITREATDPRVPVLLVLQKKVGSVSYFGALIYIPISAHKHISGLEIGQV